MISALTDESAGRDGAAQGSEAGLQDRARPEECLEPAAASRAGDCDVDQSNARISAADRVGQLPRRGGFLLER